MQTLGRCAAFGHVCGHGDSTHQILPSSQAMLTSLDHGDELANTNTDAKLRGVLGTSFNTLSTAAQNMVGANALLFGDGGDTCDDLRC